MNLTNLSSIPEETDQYTGFFVAVTIIDMTGFVCNAYLALTLVRNKSLQAPFYLIITALLISNAVFGVSSFVDSLSYFNPETFPIGYYTCTFCLYSSWVLVDMPMMMHVLISINRIWAVYFPISYRNYTKRTALAMVFAGILYSHAFLLPGFVMDALYYRSRFGDVNDCHLDSKKLKSWVMVVQIACYCFPIVFIVASTLTVLRKKRELTHQRQSTGRRMLIVLTVSIVICWLPYQVYYTVGVYRVDPTDYIYVLESLLSTLYSLQGILDPVLVVCTMPDIRKGLLKGCRHAG